MSNYYNSEYVYSTRDEMSPEEALGYLAKNASLLPVDTLDVLRAVFDAGVRYCGDQSCGCC